MDDLQDVYNDLIMEHSMNSYNKKKLETCDLCEMGHNPNCGDEIELQVKLNGDVIEDMAFSGHGCAISQASTSIMIDTLKGKTVEEAKQIIDTFIGMIKREITDEEQLKKLEDEAYFELCQIIAEAVQLQDIELLDYRIASCMIARCQRGRYHP